MNVVELSLPTINKFSSAYSAQEESILRFFTYNPFSADTFIRRKKALENRSYRRKELAAHLLGFNQKYNADDHTLHNIERLKDSSSLVIIGGQQAGLLTGPIYTISKIISIIKLAEEQETKLGVPVIPVFWIAGEDHDFQEINHVNVPKGNHIEKIQYQLRSAGKKMVSDLEMDKANIQSWMMEVMHSFGESSFTNDLQSFIENALNSSDNFVDFFSNIITKLFEGTGLVLVNASDTDLRKLETPFFQEILLQHENISSGMLKTQRDLKEMGYSPMLEIDKDSMNLFYHHNGNRELLYWNELTQHAVTKDTRKAFSMDELKKLLEEQPDVFSNNVVTRPLMQEFLFPTLAFIGGPGEISYWAELKQSFQAVELEMPPVVPRVTLTLLERHVESTMGEINETLQDVLEHGLEVKKEAWLYRQELEMMEKALSSYHSDYNEIHSKFRDLGEEMLPHLKKSFEKNWQLIDKQFAYIKHLMERSAYLKHENIMNKYERVEMSLLPKNLPQERVWNICFFLNKYGIDLVQRICKLPLEHNGQHKVIRL
jgi:bacillithiol biosynthesis cysteine-adding enzyme BshC